ncbi:hypothetical protein [Collinsella intestinalis]|uniref:hypothetical protein n=1 Tax=Collinsella intestinalis TaxID=147207 RepID=UPI0026732948|nr:hypothetical protein [Collinsella intestinalis]
MDIDELALQHSEEPAAEETPTPKRKRQAKTLEQRIAAKEEELRKLKQQAKNEARRLRTRRLVTSAATIEAEAGHVELDETIARWLGQRLAMELANPESELAKHVARRNG